MSSVRIDIDNPHVFYTNLDFISGKVVLNLQYDETIAAIVVKLEGESKTILLRPTGPGDSRRQRRDDMCVENHKVLYQLNQVFPSVDPASGTTMGLSYTLRAGQHTYPFRFKLPFNNSCATQQSHGVGLGGLLFDLSQQTQDRHVTKTLPPSLTGFPDEAEIRYFVKVTVQRPSIFKENRRSAVGFKFMPIEPPSPPATDAETFARRTHTFESGLASYFRKSSKFGKKQATTTPMSDSPPSVLVDARLPSPPILRCNQPIPLRLIIKKQAESPEIVFLITLQVDLIGHTNVRAQGVTRTEVNNWCVMSLTGLNLPIGKPGDAVGTESLVDPNLWNQIKLPSTVTPSFLTCNLTRSYEVEVRVTFGYGYPGAIQPQTKLIPLRFQAEVFSGITPPPALIDAMSHRRPGPAAPSHPSAAAASAPVYDPIYPPQLGTAGASAMEDAPPSYEDAMADDIAPVDGSRPAYSGVTNENAPSDVADQKGHTARPGRSG
ncbi:MAG: hypothetical protein M1818_006424 [Claussenomyces sp. TS43310]|nr:MAG: hypothetical protein M1818_006424 [Claussenomyces sp. TS43310]